MVFEVGPEPPPLALAHTSPTLTRRDTTGCGVRDRSVAPFGIVCNALIVLGIVILAITFRGVPEAEAAPRWERTTATWYGPGLYGNPFACSARADVPDRYTRNVRGVAHMTLPCGAKVTICRRGRCVLVRVIDTGNFHAANFDLTARTAMDLCRCWQPYTMRVRWTRGWTR